MNNKILITVKNFGPIEGPITLNLNRFIIFSGDSGLGKSYLAMLIHFVYRVVAGDDLLQFLTESKYDYDTLKEGIGDDESIICRIPTSDMVRWINSRALSFMKDMLGNQNFNGDINIELAELPENFTFLYSRKAVIGKNKEEMTYVESLKLSEMGHTIQFPQAGGWGAFPFMAMISNYLRHLYEIHQTRTFLMPPSRGSLIAVPDNLLYSQRDTMGMYIEFLNNLSTLKNSRPFEFDDDDIVVNAARMLHNDVLHGDIELSDKDILYKVDDSVVLPITAAASSVKELVPFALIIQKKLMGAYSILFEEPESHLHPDMQIKVADLVGYALADGASFQITTHSDYFLRHINDLIRLFILKNKWDDDDKFNTFCVKNNYNSGIVIDPELVSAFFLHKDENGRVVVEKQDVAQGIPFDTFNSVTDSQLASSAELYDLVDC